MTRTDLDDRSGATPTTASEAQLIGPGEAGAQRIPVNVYETTEALVLVAPMPAVRAEDVEITRRGDRLRVQAQLRSAAPREYILHEWEYGLYDREITIPETFCGPMSATLGQGQLAVSLRRAASGEGAGDADTIHPSEA